MASCSLEFVVECKEGLNLVEVAEQTKEEKAVVDHSLKNVVAFSTTKKHFCGNTTEGLLVKDGDGFKDRRIKVEFDNPRFHFISFSCACQLKATLPSGVSGVGTCGIVVVNNVTYSLTCAHNLRCWSTFYDDFITMKDGYGYKSRSGESAWHSLWELDMQKVRIHPKFNGDPACGFDIALCPVTKKPHANSGKVLAKWNSDAGWKAAEPKSLKVGMKIELVGYPGDKNGHSYYSSGEIKAIKRQPGDGWVLYYNADSTPGMSGSFIQIIDDDWVNENIPDASRKLGVKKIIIGVHTGHDDTVMLNFGTLLTPTLRKWMKSEWTEKDLRTEHKENAENLGWFDWLFGTG